MRSGDASPIFPNLRALSIGGESTSKFDSYPNALQLAPFLSPSIREVTIYDEPNGEDSTFSSQILPIIAFSCPRLESLLLERCPEACALELLWSLGSLKRLECHLIGRMMYGWDPLPDLRELARAPALSYLSISLPWDYEWVLSIPEYEATPLNNLQSLGLYGFPSTNDAVPLLTKLESPLLQRLEIGPLKYIYAKRPNEVDAFLDLLYKFPKLRTLSINGDGTDKPFALEALSQLTELEELMLDVPNALSNCKVVNFAHACPHLRYLKAYGRNTAQGTPWSLNVLEVFASEMPHLEYLETVFSTRDIGDLDAPRARSVSLITIDVGQSKLAEEHWGQVAAYISQVYPNADCQAQLEPEWDGRTPADGSEKRRGALSQWRRVSRAVAQARRGNWSGYLAPSALSGEGAIGRVVTTRSSYLLEQHSQRIY
ncbi:hypothetical protein PsYK624_138540 [Phanerochaete sordida]|uniref:F-box domain-containing protein n=1 Tax=Phanerochaete sordida TaxID=48140 RepID=A0A9P3LJQ9_9APHY|nr:hypothetical protein PsYK624_138540 [Phanerochaete sordida]